MEADIVKALLGFVLGAAATYLGLYWKVKKELEAEYDKDLRGDRLSQYKVLWALTQPFAKYSRPGPVNATELRKLSEAGRKWYFEQGGIFLSRGARNAYFALQDALVKKIAANAEDASREISGPDFDYLRTRCSQLRTAMTLDVGTRKEPLLQDEASA